MIAGMLETMLITKTHMKLPSSGSWLFCTHTYAVIVVGKDETVIAAAGFRRKQRFGYIEFEISVSHPVEMSNRLLNIGI